MDILFRGTKLSLVKRVFFISRGATNISRDPTLLPHILSQTPACVLWSSE